MATAKWNETFSPLLVAFASNATDFFSPFPFKLHFRSHSMRHIIIINLRRLIAIQWFTHSEPVARKRHHAHLGRAAGWRCFLQHEIGSILMLRHCNNSLRSNVQQFGKMSLYFYHCFLGALFLFSYSLHYVVTTMGDEIKRLIHFRWTWVSHCGNSLSSMFPCVEFDSG